MGVCKWCNEDKKLIDAHIFPKSFYDKSGYLVGANERPARSPIGIYDREILCGDCDNHVFGVLDQYAKEVLIDKKNVEYRIIPAQTPLDHNGDIKIWLLNRKRHNEIIRFFISVLWRAHVSNRHEFSNVDLGNLEIIARHAIDDSSFDFSKVFAVYIYHFKNLEHKVNITPERLKMMGINLYIFTMGNFKVYIKCDSQPYPKDLLPIMVSEETGLLLIESKLQDHRWEHEMLYDMEVILRKHLFKKKQI